jgi:hypothetical protein
VGSIHLYSDDEKIHRVRVPARLYGNLDQETADQLCEMLGSKGVPVQVVGRRDVAKAGAVALGVVVTAAMLITAFAMFEAFIAMGIAIGVGVLGSLMAISRYQTRRAWVERTLPAWRLRSLPAALPASDPLVSRLAALLYEGTPADVRDVVGELALVVQRLVDHRANFVRDRAEIDMLTAPVEPLVVQIEILVREVGQIGRELADLDEGAMVRALAASEARKEERSERTPILEALDRLRGLEDRRAAVFHRLLEAKSLLTRSVQMGLAVHDDGTEHERQLALAAATLDGRAA